jgi:hypothetical protein
MGGCRVIFAFALPIKPLLKKQTEVVRRGDSSLTKKIDTKILTWQEEVLAEHSTSQGEGCFACDNAYSQQ